MLMVALLPEYLQNTNSRSRPLGLLLLKDYKSTLPCESTLTAVPHQYCVALPEQFSPLALCQVTRCNSCQTPLAAS